MTDIIKEMIERKSVRAFEDREISCEDKNLILEAAVNAPTAGNQQLYTIIDVTDQTLKERLSESCDHQPFIAKAPLVLIFCADAQKWYDLYLDSNTMPRRPGPGDLMLAVDDAVIAAQNAVSAAWSLGIGSCYIGDIMEQAELLGQSVSCVGMYSVHNASVFPKQGILPIVVCGHGTQLCPVIFPPVAFFYTRSCHGMNGNIAVDLGNMDQAVRIALGGNVLSPHGDND